MGAVPYTISQVIQIAKISQVFAYRDARKPNFSGNQLPDKRLSRMLYMERKAVEWYNVHGTSAQLLNEMANYLLSLCAQYINQALALINASPILAPTISNPTNQSVLSGVNAVFSVTVTSSVSYTVQWYLNGVAIPGATGLSYTFMNPQLTDSGDLLSASATNSTGTIMSASATLTVTAGLTARYYFGTTDYSSDINAGNNDVAYLGTFPITSGQPLSFQWPSGAADNQYIVVEYPATESTKTTFSNAPLNNGNIPSISFDNVKTIGDKKLIFSRAGNPFSQNTLAPLIFS